MFHIRAILPFLKDVKGLSKKYKSIKGDLTDFGEILKNATPDILPGVNLGDGCYKARMAITSKNRGKSGGARIIYYAQLDDGQIVLLTIYDKSKKKQ